MPLRTPPNRAAADLHRKACPSPLPVSVLRRGLIPASAEVDALQGRPTIDDAVGERNLIQAGFDATTMTVTVIGFRSPITSASCTDLGGNLWSCPPTFSTVVASPGAG